MNETHFKINLPLTKKEYLNNNGEGVWATCDVESYKNIEIPGKLIQVKILNDSVYYQGLNCDTYITVKTNGNELRPIASFYELQSKYKSITEDDLVILLKLFSDKTVQDFFAQTLGLTGPYEVRDFLIAQNEI